MNCNQSEFVKRKLYKIILFHERITGVEDRRKAILVPGILISKVREICR